MPEAGAPDLAPLAIEAAPEIPVEGGPGIVEIAADPSFWESRFLWEMPVADAALSGVLLGTIGLYVVLARGAFVSAAVSQLSGLGVVLAMLAGGVGGAAAAGSAGPSDGSARVAGLALGVLGAGLFALPNRLRRTSVDAVLAVAVIAASALTLVGAGFLSRDYQQVKNALYGDAVVATGAEVLGVGLAAALILGIERHLRDRFVLVLFDPETAGAQGVPVRRWTLLLGLLIAASVALCTAGIGALPAFAFSVLPPTAALLLTDRLGPAFRLSAALAVGAALLGYALAFEAGLPVGPTMTGILLLPLVAGGIRSARRR